MMARNASEIAALWRTIGMDIGEGTQIYRTVHFSNGGRDPITIGKNCVLTGCTIIAHDASTNFVLGKGRSIKSPQKRVIIEDNCFIGYHSIVLMGVTIGKGSIVGAGAVVTKDVPPNSVVAGNPARVICSVQELLIKRISEYDVKDN
jgi:acetyltransferase-like isoleucine patch superfamily enzyme